MGFNQIPITKVTLDSKSNQELKGCIGKDVIYHDNKPYATPQNIMKGLALLEESSAYRRYGVEPFIDADIFAHVSFGVVDPIKMTAPLIMLGEKILDVPLEVVKNPRLLVGKRFNWGEPRNPTFRIGDVYVSDTGSMYVMYDASGA
jgi:hypothetical protein